MIEIKDLHKIYNAKKGNQFESLNKEGKTIVIITHDKEIAARCGKIIEIKDGLISAIEDRA